MPSIEVLRNLKRTMERINMKIFYIEGNIGSGKSTMIHNLKLLSKKHQPDVNYETHNKKIIFLEEPLNEWNKIIDITDGKNILQKFYEDQYKYSFAFQVMSLQTRSIQLRRAMEENPDAIIVSERSIFTDCNIFAKMLHDDGKIDPIEKEVYNLIFNETSKILDGTTQKSIYLQSSPENTFIKKCKRNRNGEEGISLEYLQKCHIYHENAFLNSDLIVNIDDYPINTPEYSRLLVSLMDYIN